MLHRSKVFFSNSTQNVRLPAEVRFPDDVREVTVRQRGVERIIMPAGNTWDSFFHNDQLVSDDFMSERPEQIVSGRESFDD